MAADFELVRVAMAPEGCFGALLHVGIPFATTLERTYDDPDGTQRVKIPAGVWTCKRTLYVRGGYETYEVMDVPGHSRLLFHRGNVENDSEGCILVGHGYAPGWPGITGSRQAFAAFMGRSRDRPTFSLAVRQG